MTTIPKLSIVLPTYKERDNLAVLIPDIEKGFSDCSIEIIVVDDNSQDGTDALIKELNEKFGNVRLITRPCLSGLGSALRDGYNAAMGTYILSSDADLSFTVEDMVRLFQKAQEGYDMVVGCRHGRNGRYERRALVIKIKYLVSLLGNAAVKAISGLMVHDFSVNFRIIKREKWFLLKTVENANVFLFEMVLRAARSGFSVSEIPVSFSERKYGESKMVLWKEVPKFFIKFLKCTFRN